MIAPLTLKSDKPAQTRVNAGILLHVSHPGASSPLRFKGLDILPKKQAVTMFTMHPGVEKSGTLTKGSFSTKAYFLCPPEICRHPASNF